MVEIINRKFKDRIMKNIYIYLLLISGLFFSACVDDTSGDVSDVTYYAVMDIIGDKEIIINQGDSWTDPGADVTLEGEPYPYDTSLTVNTSTPGVYYIEYSAVNAEGFTATATRTVVVVATAPSIYDLSGNWARSNGSPGVCVKLSDREYTYDNAGGVLGANQVTVRFINVNDVQLYIPFQENVSPSGLSVGSFAPGTITDANHFSWSLSASGFYGSFERTFSRQ